MDGVDDRPRRDVVVVDFVGDFEQPDICQRIRGSCREYFDKLSRVVRRAAGIDECFIDQQFRTDRLYDCAEASKDYKTYNLAIHKYSLLKGN